MSLRDAALAYLSVLDDTSHSLNDRETALTNLRVEAGYVEDVPDAPEPAPEPEAKPAKKVK